MRKDELSGAWYKPQDHRYERKLCVQRNYHLQTDLLNLGPEIMNNWAVLCAKEDCDISRQKVLR